MTDLDKAREWAEEYKGFDHLTHRVKAAIDTIQSLPDQWVDAEKVRELVSTFHSKENVPFTPFAAVMAFKECAEALESLITPKLPTLADMTQEEREACQWMQCRIGDTDRMGVITGYDEVGEFEYCTSVTFRDEADTWFDPSLVIPLPDLPKLEWPGGVVDCEIVDEPETVDAPPAEKAALPKPEDVPANEPWLIEVDGQKAIGTRYKGDAPEPWSVAALGGYFIGDYNDNKITLIHKLVPEPPALPEGMRLADHEEYGRVVVSPKADRDGDYKVFRSNSGGKTGAGWGYARKSKLTFLDGADA